MPKKKIIKKETGSNIEDTINEIRTKFGEEAIMKLGDKPRVDVEAISTGSIGLNHALGIGGLPRGRIVEIFGPESSGKTTLALHAVAEAQKKGGVVPSLVRNMPWIQKIPRSLVSKWMNF